ncbi:MAG: hypothetical protein WBL84_00030, partial [Xanthobacteraceae bacterium]
LVARVGARAMMTTGMAAMGAGLLLLSTIGPHADLERVELAFLGAVLAFLAIPTAALASRGDVRLISASSE